MQNFVRFVSGALLTASYVKKQVDVTVEWGKDNILQIAPNVSIDSNAGISRYLARVASDFKAYGSNLVEETEVDHWISFSLGPLSCTQEFAASVEYLDHVLGPVTYLVGNQITIADLIVWGTLLCKNFIINSHLFEK